MILLSFSWVQHNLPMDIKLYLGIDVSGGYWNVYPRTYS